MGLQFGKAGLVHLLLGVKYVKQRTRTEIQILLLIQLACAFAQPLLAAQDLQGGCKVHRLAAGFEEFLAHVKAGALDGILRRVYRMASGVAAGGESTSLIQRHLHFYPRGILRFVEHLMAGIFVIEIVLYGRLKRNSRRHLRVGVIQIGLRDIGLRPGRQHRGNQLVVRFGNVATAVQFHRERVADAVERVPAKKAHQRCLVAVEVRLILRQLGACRFDTCVGLYNVRERRGPFVVALPG